MVKKSARVKVPKARTQPKLIFRSTYHTNLKEILEFSVKMWGKKTAKEFYSEIKSKIILLPKMSSINPKCRFIESTETKTYRNIIVRKYYIIYCVKNTEITVIDIIHQSISPENMKKRIE
jgi:plasmid stabilization system protein ParE